jgi:O-antigen/teichoic acid export membrane protein
VSLVKTFAKFSIGTWVSAGISIASVPVTAWFISPEEFGKASMFTLAYNLVLNFVLFGTDQSFSRFYLDVDRKARHHLLKETLLPCLCSLGIAVFSLIIFKNRISVILFDSDNLSYTIYLLCVLLFIGLLSRFSLLSIRMKSEAVIYSKIQIVYSIVSFVVIIGYAKFISNTLDAIIIASIVAQFVQLLLSLAYDFSIWQSLGRTIGGVEWKNVRRYLIYGLPFVPTFMLDWVFQSIDRTFLRIYTDFNQIGLYALAFKVSLSLSVIQSGFATFWLPYSLEQYKNKPEQKQFYSIVFNSLTFVFGVLIILVVLFQDFIMFILPDSYNGIVPIFPFILLVPMLYTLSEITVVGINFKSKTIYHIYVIVIALLANVITAFLLIPKFGATGAAMSLSIGYMVFFIMRTVFGRKNYYFSLDFLKFIIAILVIFVPISLTVFVTETPWYLLGILSLVVLFVLYRIDLKRVRQII